MQRPTTAANLVSSIGVCVCLKHGALPLSDNLPVQPNIFWENLPATAPKDTKSFSHAVAHRIAKQYSSFSPKKPITIFSDPTSNQLQNLCLKLREEAGPKTVLFHFYGIGLPSITTSGQMWVYNHDHSQFLPLQFQKVLKWIGVPSLIIMEHPGSRKLSTLPIPKGIALFLSPSVFPNAEFFSNSDMKVPLDIFSCSLLSPIRSLICFGDPKIKPPSSSVQWLLFNSAQCVEALHRLLTGIVEALCWKLFPRQLFQVLFRSCQFASQIFLNFIVSLRIYRGLKNKYLPVLKYNLLGHSASILHVIPNDSLWSFWDTFVSQAVLQLSETKSVSIANSILHKTLYSMILSLHNSVTDPSFLSFLPFVLQLILFPPLRLPSVSVLTKTVGLYPTAAHQLIDLGFLPYMSKLVKTSDALVFHHVLYLLTQFSIHRPEQFSTPTPEIAIKLISCLLRPPSYSTACSLFLLARLFSRNKNQAATMFHQYGLFSTLISLLSQCQSYPILETWVLIVLGLYCKSSKDIRRLAFPMNLPHILGSLLVTTLDRNVRIAIVFTFRTLLLTSQSQNGKELFFNISLCYYSAPATQDGFYQVRLGYCNFLMHFMSLFYGPQPPNLTAAQRGQISHCEQFLITQLDHLLHDPFIQVKKAALALTELYFRDSDRLMPIAIRIVKTLGGGGDLRESSGESSEAVHRKKLSNSLSSAQLLTTPNVNINYGPRPRSSSTGSTHSTHSVEQVLSGLPSRNTTPASTPGSTPLTTPSISPRALSYHFIQNPLVPLPSDSVNDRIEKENADILRAAQHQLSNFAYQYHASQSQDAITPRQNDDPTTETGRLLNILEQTKKRIPEPPWLVESFFADFVSYETLVFLRALEPPKLVFDKFLSFSYPTTQVVLPKPFSVEPFLTHQLAPEKGCFNPETLLLSTDAVEWHSKKQKSLGLIKDYYIQIGLASDQYSSSRPPSPTSPAFSNPSSELDDIDEGSEVIDTPLSCSPPPSDFSSSLPIHSSKLFTEIDSSISNPTSVVAGSLNTLDHFDPKSINSPLTTKAILNSPQPFSTPPPVSSKKHPFSSRNVQSTRKYFKKASFFKSKSSMNVNDSSSSMSSSNPSSPFQKKISFVKPTFDQEIGQIDFQNHGCLNVLFHPYEPIIFSTSRTHILLSICGKYCQTKIFPVHKPNTTVIKDFKFVRYDTPRALVSSFDSTVSIYKYPTVPFIKPAECIASFLPLPSLPNKQRKVGITVDLDMHRSLLFLSGDVDFLATWDLERMTCVSASRTGSHGARTTALKALPLSTSSLVFAGFGDGSLRCYDIRMPSSYNQSVVVPSIPSSYPTKIHFPSGNSSSEYHLYTASSTGSIYLFDLRQPIQVLSSNPGKSGHRRVAFHPNLDFIATSHQNSFQILDSSLNPLTKPIYSDGFLGQRMGTISCLGFHPFEQVIATGRPGSLTLFSTPKSGSTFLARAQVLGESISNEARFYQESQIAAHHSNKFIPVRPKPQQPPSNRSRTKSPVAQHDTVALSPSFSKKKRFFSTSDQPVIKFPDKERHFLKS